MTSGYPKSIPKPADSGRHRFALACLLVMLATAVGCAHRQTAIFEPTAATPASGLAAGADTDPAVSSPAAEGTGDAVSDTGDAVDEYDDEYDDEYGDEDGAFQPLVPDPIAPFNRAMFTLNDRLYFYALKPVAQGYRAVMPVSARSGIHNFFYNLSAPARFLSCLLQGKTREGAAELGRFALNTTVGVLGFGNPASKFESLNPPAEDLGQTLARYHVGDGFYIVWPIFGPSTLRDTVGRVGDAFLGPLSYATTIEQGIGIYAVDNLNTLSLHIGDYEALKAAAIEPYDAFRDAYIQYRLKQIDE